MHDLHMDHAFQGVQARARHGGHRRVGVRPLPPYQLGVAHAREIAGAREQAPGGVQADGLDEFAPQRAQRLGMHQHHALVLQPDAAVAR